VTIGVLVITAEEVNGRRDGTAVAIRFLGTFAVEIGFSNIEEQAPRIIPTIITSPEICR